MSFIFCPTKEKNVEVYIDGISASALEDINARAINGRIECSDNDIKCTSENCPFFKDK